MNARSTYILMTILASVGALSASPVFAATEAPVSIWTDKSVYDHNSVIMVQGKVANVRMDTDVTIKVTSPSNNLVTIEQVKVNSDGTFKATLNTASILWKYDGVYVIRANYGVQPVGDKILVELVGGEKVGGQKPSACNAGELDASGHCIPYSISGASVKSAKLSVGTTSLIIQIASNSEGMITLNIPRSVLDATLPNGNDDQLFVLVDGEEALFDETKDSQTRSITIMFPDGAEKIEVIGTFVVPEFGTVAALILAVAIISIVAVTARSRLSIMPKY